MVQDDVGGSIESTPMVLKKLSVTGEKRGNRSSRGVDFVQKW